MFEDSVRKMATAALIPVVKLDEEAAASGLAGALLEGGIRAVEVTFRTTEGEAGYARIAACISRIAREHPEMLVGAGTVINASLAERARNAGARFVVSPGFNPRTVDWCVAHGVPVVPGVNSPTQVEEALERGLCALKFFPAEVSGGVAMLRALAGPFPTVRFLPTGGINERNAADYFACPNVFAVGGSWMVKESLVRARDWDTVAALSRQAVRALRG